MSGLVQVILFLVSAFNELKIMLDVAHVHDNWKMLKLFAGFIKVFDRRISRLECFNQATQNYGL